MSAIIKLENVTKRYGKQKALDDVSLEVKPGVVFALLGENGAGKTTAIRVLLGLTLPDSGVVETLGIPVYSRSVEIRRRVGYVPVSTETHRPRR